MTYKQTTIVITGASSGLGAALANEYAAPESTLHLFGRNEDRLNKVANLVRTKGAKAQIHTDNVTDQAAIANTLLAIDKEDPIDLLIANAGISAGTSGKQENEDQTRTIFDTNLTGIMNTVLPILPLMRKRQQGQIAFVSSMASFRGLASAPAYCASKGAIRIFGEALRSDVAKDNVQINVICPGFVRTPLTDLNSFKMPFLMEPNEAAQKIRNGLAQNQGRIIFPWPMIFIGWCLRAFPDVVLNWLSSHLPRS